MKPVRCERGVWVNVRPNLGRPAPYPDEREDVVSHLAALEVRYARTGRARLRGVHVGGSGRLRSWTGFVPASALDDLRQLLEQHGLRYREVAP